MNPYIIIPAYNEVKILPPLLDRLRLLGASTTFGVVFCDNASTDGTGDLVRAYIKTHDLAGWDVINEPQKGTGAASDTAARYAIGLGATHLLRTDADAIPAMDWVSAYERMFNTTDYELIAGRVQARTDEGLSLLRRKLINLVYEVTRLGASLYYRKSSDPAKPYLGPHRMLTGGNMGITADLYERAGGFLRGSIEETHEDLQLLLAVRRLTDRYCYAPQILVYQSARRLQAWGILNTIKWYTEHSWRPAPGKPVDIR